MGLLVLHLSGLVLNAYVTHVSEAGAPGPGGGAGTGRGAGAADLGPGSRGRSRPGYNQVSRRATGTARWRASGSVVCPADLPCLAQLHAEYNRQKDVYLTHRVAQAWELAQFIQCVSLGLTGEVGWGPGLRGLEGRPGRRLQGGGAGREEAPPHPRGFPSHTSKKADVVLLCGDLNLHPKDLGCRLLKEWTGLHDAYHETRDFKVRRTRRLVVPTSASAASLPGPS